MSQVGWGDFTEIRKMKVLGIVCSPRLNGNTQVMMEEALRAAAEMGAETELYLAGQKDIAPCDACDFCQGTGVCRIEDDMQELYTKILESDGIIVGSPVYYWYVTAQAKAIIDRTYRFKLRRNLAGKVGGALVVARDRGETTALSALLGWFSGQRLLIAAAASARAEHRGEVRGNPAAMEEAARVGRAVAAMVRQRSLPG